MEWTVPMFFVKTEKEPEWFSTGPGQSTGWWLEGRDIFYIGTGFIFFKIL